MAEGQRGREAEEKDGAAACRNCFFKFSSNVHAFYMASFATVFSYVKIDFTLCAILISFFPPPRIHNLTDDRLMFNCFIKIT